MSLAALVALGFVACAVGNGNPSPPDVTTAPSPGSGTSTPGGPSDTSSSPGPGADGGVPSDSSSTADGSAPDASACLGFAAPTTTAPCHGCGSHACQPNGCYGGYYCDLGATKCVPKPASCP